MKTRYAASQVTLNREEILIALKIGGAMAKGARQRGLKAHGGKTDEHYKRALYTHYQSALSEKAFSKWSGLAWNWELKEQRDRSGRSLPDFYGQGNLAIEVRSKRTTKDPVLGVKRKDLDHPDWVMALMCLCSQPNKWDARIWTQKDPKNGWFRALLNDNTAVQVWKCLGYMPVNECQKDKWKNPQFTGKQHEYIYLIPSQDLYVPYLLQINPKFGDQI